MLRTFQDENLPRTRRSIFVFTFFAAVVYRFQPTINLSEIGFFSDLSQQTIEPKNFGCIVILAIFYLLWRLVHFIPIYQNQTNRTFELFFEKLEQRNSHATKTLEAKLSALEAIDRQAIDEKIKEFDIRRNEMIEKLKEIKETVSVASGTLQQSVSSVTEHLNGLTRSVPSIPGDTSNPRDISKSELTKKYRELLEPPPDMRNPFEAIGNVVDMEVIDLRDMILPSIAPELNYLETRLRDVLDGDYSLVDRFEDNTKDARRCANAEANTFTIWVPALVASVGLAFGFCLICQTEGYIKPLIAAFVIAVPTVCFVKGYRPGSH